MVSSTLVNVAEDAELRLVRLLAETAPNHLLSPTFLSDCENCIVQSDASALMKTIVGDAGAISSLFILEPVDEAISAFSLLALLLLRIGSEESSLATVLADAVVNCSPIEGKTDEEQAVRCITLLSCLYNLRSDGIEKCTLLSQMIKLSSQYKPEMLSEGQPIGNLLIESEGSSLPLSSAAAMVSGNAAAVPSSSTSLMPPIVSLLDSWNVPPKNRRALYRAAADGIPDSVSRKQRFTLLLVETYEDMSEVDEEGINAAKDAAIGAIRDPVTLFVEQRSMLSLPAIKALDTNPSTKKLYGLLSIFQEGKLEDYNKFMKENGGEDSVLSEWSLSKEDCFRQMRILSLCSLAAEHEEIPYDTVAKTLQLPAGVDVDVESWVIAAVSSGLLSAKMDQLRKSVMVERSVVRRFDEKQWKALQSRLQVWKQNVKGILDGFQQAQQQPLA